MGTGLIARLAVAALLLRATPASAGSIEVDLPGALERARRAAPEAIAARGQLAVARAAVAGAEVALTDNPELELGGGPRLTDPRRLDVELRIEQSLEPGRGGPRRRAARAGVVRTAAELDAELRRLELEVAAAFYEALHAERAGELARRAEDLARRAAEAAERRRRAGDLTDLDANLARVALGRARSAVQAAASDQAAAVGRLAALIGAAPDDAIALRGELRPAPVGELTALRAATARRADLRVLDAERAAASAAGDVARASGLPQLALWASYHREDTDTVVLGGVRMSLPVWNRAPGDRAAAAAAARRATETRAATARVADRQLADALAAHASAAAAVDDFERDVAPVLDDSERLLERTVDAGQLAVSAYLVARQELLAGRREHLDRLLALARAALAVRFAAGVSP